MKVEVGETIEFPEHDGMHKRKIQYLLSNVCGGQAFVLFDDNTWIILMDLMSMKLDQLKQNHHGTE